MRAAFLFLLALPVLGAGLAAAQEGAPDAAALQQARQEAEQAMARSRRLEQEAEEATSDAARARAEAEALAARIQAGEADITAAETRLRIVEALAARQRARLAARQGPVVRLTAALQTMARRPPALALVQPGSIDRVVHVRAMLASTLPAIRARTAGLRAELDTANRLRAQAGQAHEGLVESREELQRRRTALAGFEAQQRRRSESLAESALFESDRALALGEEARELARQMGTREFQQRLGARLAELPGPVPRPNSDTQPRRERPPFMIPVDGRLLVGVGEISNAGVHARGLTFATAANAPVVAPASGRVLYAAPFRGYGHVVIVDHGNGWHSVVTHLASIDVAVGDSVERGRRVGRAGEAAPQVSVELRRGGRPVEIAPLISG